MEIPNNISLGILVALFLLNISLVILNIGSVEIWSGNFFNPTQNFCSSAIGGMIFFLIAHFTKEKALGWGDVRVMYSLGLFLSLSQFVYSFYIMLFTSITVGLIYAIKIRRFKDLPIPFVPFLVTGATVAFLFTNQIAEIISIN